MIDKSRIEFGRRRTLLSTLVRAHTKLRPSAGGWVGCCIFHKDRNPSMHVSDVRQTYKCFSCGAQGDIFDFLIQTKGLTFAQAIDELAGEAAPAPFIERAVAASEGRAEDTTRRIAHAHHLWLKRLPVEGTVAERYLRDTRCIAGPYPGVLGYVRSAYCSVIREETEALIAPLQDRRGHVTAVQQIFLCRETEDAWRDPAGKRVKRTLGSMADGCVRLGLPDTVLGLAGSVEDALAAASLYSLPVWATCGEQRMARVWVPPEVQRLVIFADYDDAGRKAAQDAYIAHRGRARVETIFPQEGKDFAAVTEKRAG